MDNISVKLISLLIYTAGHVIGFGIHHELHIVPGKEQRSIQEDCHRPYVSTCDVCEGRQKNFECPNSQSIGDFCYKEYSYTYNGWSVRLGTSHKSDCLRFAKLSRLINPDCDLENPPIGTFCYDCCFTPKCQDHTRKCNALSPINATLIPDFIYKALNLTPPTTTPGPTTTATTTTTPTTKTTAGTPLPTSTPATTKTTGGTKLPVLTPTTKTTAATKYSTSTPATTKTATGATALLISTPGATQYSTSTPATTTTARTIITPSINSTQKPTYLSLIQTAIKTATTTLRHGTLCQVCIDDDHNMCSSTDYVYCPLHAPYCMNDNSYQNNRTQVVKRCTDEIKCFWKSWIETQNDPKCNSTSQRNIVDNTCHYCCQTDYEKSLPCNVDKIPKKVVAFNGLRKGHTCLLGYMQYHEEECPAHLPFCMNDVFYNTRRINKTPDAVKRCVSEEQCKVDWWNKSRIRPECWTGDLTNISDGNLLCHYCCLSDGNIPCNRLVIPSQIYDFTKAITSTVPTPNSSTPSPPLSSIQVTTINTSQTKTSPTKGFNLSLTTLRTKPPSLSNISSSITPFTTSKSNSYTTQPITLSTVSPMAFHSASASTSTTRLRTISPTTSAATLHSTSPTVSSRTLHITSPTASTTNLQIKSTTTPITFLQTTSPTSSTTLQAAFSTSPPTSLHSTSTTASSTSLRSTSAKSTTASTTSLHSTPTTTSTTSLHSTPTTTSTTSLHSTPTTTSTTSLRSTSAKSTTASTTSLHSTPTTTSTTSLHSTPTTTSTTSLRSTSAKSTTASTKSLRSTSTTVSTTTSKTTMPTTTSIMSSVNQPDTSTKVVCLPMFCVLNCGNPPKYKLDKDGCPVCECAFLGG